MGAVCEGRFVICRIASLVSRGLRHGNGAAAHQGPGARPPGEEHLVGHTRSPEGKGPAAQRHSAILEAQATREVVACREASVGRHTPPRGCDRGNFKPRLWQVVLARLGVCGAPA